MRAALSQMARDLSGAVVSARLPIYLNVAGNTRVSIPTSLSSQLPIRVGNPGVNWQSISAILFFSSAQPSRSGQAGDLAGIGYFVAWDTNANNGNGAFNLYRRYQSPPTFTQPWCPDGVATRTHSGAYQIIVPYAEIVGARPQLLVSPSFCDNTTTGTVEQNLATQLRKYRLNAPGRHVVTNVRLLSTGLTVMEASRSGL